MGTTFPEAQSASAIARSELFKYQNCQDAQYFKVIRTGPTISILVPVAVAVKGIRTTRRCTSGCLAQTRSLPRIFSVIASDYWEIFTDVHNIQFLKIMIMPQSIHHREILGGGFEP
jgi:hypothetical protein